MKFEDLKDLLAIFKESGLTYMEYEQDGIRVTFDSKKMANAPVAPLAPQTIQPVSTTDSLQPEVDNNKYVTSPLVGTFHNAPYKDAKPFVSVGTKVKKGDKLCIIEAMKVMNEITSPYDGIVKEILVNDNDVVDFGKKLFVIGD